VLEPELNTTWKARALEDEGEGGHSIFFFFFLLLKNALADDWRIASSFSPTRISGEWRHPFFPP